MKPDSLIEPEEKSFFGKALVWVETHTIAVAFIATVLVIIIAVLVISHFYSQSRFIRAQQALKDAISAKYQGNIDEAIAGLNGAKKSFGDTAMVDKYSYELANLYYETGKLEDAKKEYEWFSQHYPNSPLNDGAVRAYGNLKKDIEWRDKELPKIVAMNGIDPPFGRGSSSADIAGPVMLSTTKFDLETDKGNKLSFELFDNNAPNTVTNFVGLVNKNIYNGVKLYVSGDKDISPEVTMVEPLLPNIPLEKNAKVAERGTLVLTQDHPAKFSVLLKTADSATLAYSCVFGKMTSGFDTLSKIQSGETISKMTLTEKRDSYPELKTLKK